MKIRIGYSTTDSLWSKAIRWFTQANVSHSYIRIYDEYLHAPLIIHADLPGVIIEHADIFDLTNVVIEEFEIDDERLEIGIKKNLRYLRRKYDWRNILNWALVIKFKRWFKRKVRHPLEAPKKMICVDIVAGILNDSGITHLPLGDLHPKSLRIWMNEHYKEFGWIKIGEENERSTLIP